MFKIPTIEFGLWFRGYGFSINAPLHIDIGWGKGTYRYLNPLAAWFNRRYGLLVL